MAESRDVARMACVVCEATMNTNEENESAWYPEPWCLACMTEEDERGLRDELLPFSNIRFSMPRYFFTKAEWCETEGSARFDELVKQLLEGAEEDEGND
jgi:hypothetical protein